MWMNKLKLVPNDPNKFDYKEQTSIRQELTAFQLN